MSDVFALQNVTSPEKLTLLAMADHASDDGRNCFPAVATLAHKTSQSRRGIQKILRRLEQGGLVVPDGRSSYGKAGRCTTRYRLTIPHTLKPNKADAEPAKPSTPKPDSPPKISVEQAKEGVRQVWDYYLKAFDRRPTLNTFRPKYEKWGLECFAHIASCLREPVTKEQVVNVMQKCVDAMSEDDFSNGLLPISTAKYTEWKHLFGTHERLEKWLNCIEQ
jgi:hypothetical protein